MRLVKLIFIILCFDCYLISPAFGQSDFVVAGGQTSGSGGKADYSIGQTNFIYNNNSSGTVSQGVQQPVEIYVIKGQNVKGVDLVASAFPNPAPGYVILSIDEGLIENLSYKIYDELGQIISSNEIVEKETRISLSQLSNTVLFLTVLKNNFEIKSFKIINSK